MRAVWIVSTATLAACAASAPPRVAPPSPSAEWRASVPQAAPGPAATPPAGPLPGPAASPGLGFATAHALIPFVSNRQGSFDVYLLDVTAATVWAPPGANTDGDEANPSLTLDNHALVYATNAPGHFDIWLYDMRTQQVNLLETLNTPADEVSPVIDAVGRELVYTSNLDGPARLHLFDLKTGQNFVPAAVARLGTPISNPFISADDSLVVFSTPLAGRGLELLCYDTASGRVWEPPFVNTPADEDEPVISLDRERLAFSTNRRGHWDVMLAHMRTGMTDALPLANSPADDLTPAFFGPRGEALVFCSDRTGPGDRRLYSYRLADHLLNTLSISHEPGHIDSFSLP